MALPREYAGENCSIARALEVVGERWTLLVIVRDAFYGVSRFSDFRDHLRIPRAVLTERLNLLVEHDILARVTAPSGRDEYSLTVKGRRLWPAIWSLITWGDEYYMAGGQRRRFTHAGCGGAVTAEAGGRSKHAGPGRSRTSSPSTPGPNPRGPARRPTRSAGRCRSRTGCSRRSSEPRPRPRGWIWRTG